MVAHKALI